MVKGKWSAIVIAVGGLIGVFCYSNEALAQDLMVTQKGDSINCEIIKTTTEYLYYKIPVNGELKAQVIELKKVAGYEEDYYDVPALPPPPSESLFIEDGYARVSNAPNFFLSLDGAVSQLSGGIDPTIEPFIGDYLEALKSGTYIGATGTYFFSENHGAGVRMHYFATSNRLDSLSFSDNSGAIIFGSLVDSITSLYIGPQYTYRSFLGNTNNWIETSIGVGYTSYANYSVQVQRFTLKGQKLATDLNLRMVMPIGNGIYFATQLGMFTSVFTSVTVSSPDGFFEPQEIDISDNPEIASRYNFGISLGIGF